MAVLDKEECENETDPASAGSHDASARTATTGGKTERPKGKIAHAIAILSVSVLLVLVLRCAI
jgi:hypothetical protein